LTSTVPDPSKATSCLSSFTASPFIVVGSNTKSGSNLFLYENISPPKFSSQAKKNFDSKEGLVLRASTLVRSPVIDVSSSSNHILTGGLNGKVSLFRTNLLDSNKSERVLLQLSSEWSIDDTKQVDILSFYGIFFYFLFLFTFATEALILQINFLAILILR